MVIAPPCHGGDLPVRIRSGSLKETDMEEFVKNIIKECDAAIKDAKVAKEKGRDIPDNYVQVIKSNCFDRIKRKITL